MKFIITVLALSFSFSAFAEKPKDAPGCTQEQVKTNKCIPTRKAGEPTLSEEVLSSIRAKQKQYFDYLKRLKKTEDQLTKAERDAFEQQSVY